jgi:CspA family cold shock protein
MEEMRVYTGQVVWFNDKRGYGFVKLDDGSKDMFVHYTNIDSDAKFKTLVAGQRVSYVLGQNKNGPQAEQIRVVEEAEEE